MSTKNKKNTMKMMTTVRIPPWREEEVFKNIVAMCQTSGTTDVAIMYMCHPEGLPLMKKNEDAAEQFLRIKKVLAANGIRAGVLVQSLLDHGERFQPLSPASFQRIVGFDGTESRSCFCPMDKGFLIYVRETITVFSKTKPDFILIDDDVRLDNHSPARWACACPLHVELLNSRAGTRLTRDEIFAAMKRDDNVGQEVRRAWIESGDESLLELMRVIREAIDLVDPSIRCGKCVSGGKSLFRSEKLVKALAGKTRPLMRFGHAFYMQNGYEFFPSVMSVIAAQKKQLVDKTIEQMCEADTFFHTRYHTPVKSMRGYIAGTILSAGIDIPYTWIPGTIEWIPEDVAAYSSALKSSIPFFHELKKTADTVTWSGPTVIMNGNWRFSRSWNESAAEGNEVRHWGASICGHLGIPSTVNNLQSLVCMLDGEQAVYDLSRAEIIEWFKKGMLLDGAAAKALCRLGFSEHMGIEVSDGDDDLRYYTETFGAEAVLNGSAAGKRMYAMRSQSSTVKRMKIVDSKVRVVSSFMDAPWADSLDFKSVSPALVVFENKLGGRVAVYAHELSPVMVKYSFLSDIRKEQLIRVLTWLGKESLQAVAQTSVNTWFLCGKSGLKNEYYAAIFNLNQDEIESLRLQWTVGRPAGIKMLTDKGGWKTVSMKFKDGISQLKLNVKTMQPLVLWIRT